MRCRCGHHSPCIEMRTSVTSRGALRTALVILDLISDYAYSGGERLLPQARQVATRAAQLRRRARRRGIPVIYVNDTRGRWESDQASFIRRCLDASPAAAGVVERILPGRDDYFMFKPRHSAFYATPLAELLYSLNIGTLVLTGITSHQCVLFTAIDAHVRGYAVVVARDAVAASSAEETRHALFILEHSIGARILGSRYIRFR